MKRTGLRALLGSLLAILLILSSGVVLAADAGAALEETETVPEATESESARSYIPVVLTPTVSTESLGGSLYKVKADNLLWASHVQIPTWSQENGQDDIVWYTARHEGNGIWSAVVNTAPHGGGVMISHVYANGMSVGSTSYVTPTAAKPGVSVQALGGTRFRITAYNLPWASKVQIPTWSEKNGQDDIVWHNAAYDGNGVWSTYVDSTPHGGGRMFSHVYADDKPVGSVTYMAPETPQIKVYVEPLGGSRFRIVATNVPWASKVQVPTWSEKNGPDDLAWYSAGPAGSGSWAAVIDSNQHGGGRMVSQVYADGKQIGSVTYVAPVVPKVTVTAEPLGGTRFRILIHNLSDASKVQVPTWSEEKGQDDIAWYQAGYDGYGTWSAVLDAAAHGGGYMISHVYADGRPVGSVTYITDFVDRPTISLESVGGAHYRIVIRNLPHAKEVTVPTWNETTGNTIVYTAAYDGKGVWSTLINAADLGPGRIISYIYADGRKVGQTQAFLQYTT